MAIAHILFLKVRQSEIGRAEEALKAIANLKNRLPDLIVSVHLGTNFSQRSKGFTHGFTMIFKDKAALETYDKSDEHVEVVTNIVRPVFEELICVDYEVADFSSPSL
ncbi:hypothetical protein B0O80DRAFT_420919 [Mortierella sp. GBAus27b]|nr:hypothetical protein B0O80DRAFT_420919 [Mortierella sp. GBAus27b]